MARPNILLLLTDDQRMEPDGAGNRTVDVMPNTLAEFADRGVAFPNHYVTTPLCDPSRATIYSGLYASNHGVIGNEAEAEWDQFYSVQRQLQAVGYRTGLIGKFTTGGGAVPAEYFDYIADVLQTATELPVTLSKVEEFINDPDTRPWFLVVSTPVPHRPYNAVPDTPITLPTFTLPASSAEASLTDKHQTVQNQSSHYDPALAQEDFEGQLNELAALDEIIPDIFALFTPTERNEMLAIFTSDNGYEWGDHKLHLKDWPYVESMHVPLYMSWPDVLGEGTTDNRLTANIDLAATILDAADVVPDYAMKGFSLLGADTRSWLYTEIPDPDFARYSRSYLSLTRHYVQWLDNPWIEDYDLTADPTEEDASNVTDAAIETLLDSVGIARITPAIVIHPTPTVAPKPREIVTELPDGAISESHTISTFVEVLADGVAITTDLPVLDGSVTLDASAAARGRASLTIPGLEELIPTDPDSPLNVYGTEVAIYRGIETATEKLLVPLGVYGIQQSTVHDSGGDLSVAISGVDRMGRFIAPESAFESAGEITSGTLAGAAIIAVLTDAWPDLPYNADEFDAISVPLPMLAYEEVEDRSAFAIGVATAIGYELYFDGLGELRIRAVPTTTGDSPVAEITEGEGGTLLAVDRDFDRSRVVNRWTVIGQNPSNDDTAPIPRGVAVDDNPNSPTYYFGQNSFGRTFGRRLDSYDNSFIGSDTQAADAAAGLLARSIGAPDQVSLGAVVDPARAPSDVVWIERTRLGLAAAHILDSVTIPLGPEGEMTATTRITQVLE